MNRRKRVMAVIRGENFDRVPAMFSSPFLPEQRSGARAVTAHVDYFNAAMTDICKVMNEHQLRSDVVVHRPKDLYKENITAASRQGLKDLAEIVKRVADELGESVPIVVTIHGPVASVHHMSGRKGWFLDNREFYKKCFTEDKSAYIAALTAATDGICDLTYQCLKAGADGIYFAALGAHNDLFTDDEYEEIVRPFDLQVLKESKKANGFNILHICGTDLAVRRFTDYPAEVVNWEFGHGNPSMEESIELFDSNHTILGGLENNRGSIFDGTDEDIKKEVHGVLDTFSGRRFILGTGCTISPDAKPERIRIAVQACASWTAKSADTHE